jgi:hypothetical protein
MADDENQFARFLVEFASLQPFHAAFESVHPGRVALELFGIGYGGGTLVCHGYTLL